MGELLGELLGRLLEWLLHPGELSVSGWFFRALFLLGFGMIVAAPFVGGAIGWGLAGGGAFCVLLAATMVWRRTTGGPPRRPRK